MRAASGLFDFASSNMSRPKPSWVESRSVAARAKGGIAIAGAVAARRGKPSFARQAVEKHGEVLRGRVIEPGKPLPFGAVGDPLLRLEQMPSAPRFISPAWLSLWPAKGRSPALDRIGDEAGRPVVGRGAVEGFEHAFPCRDRRDWS